MLFCTLPYPTLPYPTPLYSTVSLCFRSHPVLRLPLDSCLVPSFSPIPDTITASTHTLTTPPPIFFGAIECVIIGISTWLDKLNSSRTQTCNLHNIIATIHSFFSFLSSPFPFFTMIHDDFWSVGFGYACVVPIHAILSLLFGYLLIETPCYYMFVAGFAITTAATGLPHLVYVAFPAATSENAKFNGALCSTLSIVCAVWDLLGTCLFIGLDADGASMSNPIYCAVFGPIVLCAVVLSLWIFWHNVRVTKPHEALGRAPTLSESNYTFTMTMMRQNVDYCFSVLSTLLMTSLIGFAAAFVFAMVMICQRISWDADISISKVWTPMWYQSLSLAGSFLIVACVWTSCKAPIIAQRHVRALYIPYNVTGIFMIAFNTILMQVAAQLDIGGSNPFFVLWPIVGALSVFVLWLFVLIALRRWKWRVVPDQQNV